MFNLPTTLHFATGDTEPELRGAFRALAAAFAPAGTGAEATFTADVDLGTETFWAILHGLATLERSGRIRPGARDERIALVVRALLGPDH